MTETWKAIPGYEGMYEVSSIGRVRSMDRITRHHRRRRGVVLRQATTKSGYRVVCLHRDNRRFNFRVNRLVALAFLGVPPPGKQFVLHGDDNPLNNSTDNLRWGDASDNMRDKSQHGRNPNRNKKYCSRGHEYTAENTYTRWDGCRDCRICMRIRAKQYYHNKKEALTV